MSARWRIHDRVVLLPLLLIVLGVLVALGTASRLHQSRQELADERFESLALRVVSQVESRIRTYEYGLRGTRGAVIGAGVEALTRERFFLYSRSRELAREFPGARGYGFIRRVPREEEAAYVRAAQLDGKPDFRITQLEPHPGDRFVIQYIEPEALNQEAVGLDIASSFERRFAALSAVRSGNATLTAPVTLVQATGQEKKGFLILLPVYRGGLEPDTPEERWEKLYGWAYAPVIIDEVLADFDFRGGEFSLALGDVSYAASPIPFFASKGSEQPAALGLRRVHELPLYGRVWQVEVKALPPFTAQFDASVPYWTGASLLGFFLLLATLLHSYLIGVRRRIQTTAEEARLAALAEHSARLQRNEEALRRSEGFLAAVADNVPSMIMYWDENARCRFANRAFLEFIGKPLAAVLGESNESLLGSELWAANREPLQAALGGQAQHFERTVSSPSGGSARHLWWYYIPDRDMDSVRGVYAVVTDISDLKESQIQLQALNAALQRQSELAESANRAKSEFVANMSHEIRTPLNAVLGLAYLIERSELTPGVRDMVRKIESAGRLLLGIINDILDFSKIEAGRLEVERQPFRLGEILDDLANMMSYAAEGKPVEVVVGPSPALAPTLIGDPLRLRQVLTNLASNGIKFTESGYVAVRVSVIDLSPGEVTLRFSVKDTGIGIPPEKRREIFAPFAQVDASISRRFGGTGLGLAISRRLVELMGGELVLTSEPGRGSEFSFAISFERGVEDPALGSAPRTQRVLVVDDHPLAREALAAIVAALGWTADVVASGEEAIRVVEDGIAAGKPFDLLLVDWKMPGLDGLAVADAVRHRCHDTTHPIIVMVTAADRDELLAEPESILADAVLTKPVTGSSLLDTVLKLQGSPGTSIAGRGGIDEQSASPVNGLRVLVVDDSEINREVATRILEGEGARVATAEDGARALEMLCMEPNGFDIVLMDVQMPVMDGYEATRRIRAHEALRGLPVIALTAGAFRSQHDAAMAAGMDAFLAKPFVPEELMSAIARCVRHLDPAPARVLQDKVQTDEAELVLDAQRGLNSWRTEAAYTGYLRRFVEQHGRDAERLLALMGESDREGAQACAHKLRGAAGALALMRLARAASELEQALRDDGDVMGALERVSSQLEATREAIEHYVGGGASHASAEIERERDEAASLEILRRLLAALDADDPGVAEPILEELSALRGEAACEPIRRSLAEFDFHAARRCVADLIRAAAGAGALDAGER